MNEPRLDLESAESEFVGSEEIPTRRAEAGTTANRVLSVELK